MTIGLYNLSSTNMQIHAYETHTFHHLPSCQSKFDYSNK